MKQTLLFLAASLAVTLAVTAVQAQQAVQRPTPRTIQSATSSLVVESVKTNSAVNVQAVDQIVATNQVERNASATYTAGKAVLLQPGFEAKAGSVLVALVAPVSIKAVEPGTTLTLSAWPNPFQTQTTIEYNLPENGPVKHTLTDARGSIIRQDAPVDAQSAGKYKVGVDGSNLPTGVYIYQLQTGSQTKVIRLLKQ